MEPSRQLRPPSGQTRLRRSILCRPPLRVLALVVALLVGLLLVAGAAAAQNAYSASEDGTVRKIDSTGSEVWSFDGTGQGNQFLGVAVDADGNVYAGDEKGNVFKIDSSGNEVWAFSISGEPKVHGIAVDGDGNVYVGDENGDVTKLDSTGSQVWSVAPSGGDKIHSLIPDGSGNVYAGTDTPEVVKLDSSGSEVWTFSPSKKPRSLTVNPSGDVFMGDDQGNIVKISSSGSEVWSFSAHSNKVFDLAFDGKGSLYSASEDKTVKKIDPSGPTEVWSFPDPDGKKAFGLGIDSDRHVHYGSEGGKVFKLETDGSGTVWTFSGHSKKVFGATVDPGAFTMSTDGTPPTVTSITTLDRDGDGKVDGANVVFSEAIDDSTVTASDWSIGGQAAEAFSTTVDGDADADDDRIQLRITTDGNEVAGTDAKDVTYTQGTTEDLAGHKLADVASGDIAEVDGAQPVVSSITTRDRDTDGKVDGADVIFTEAIDDSTITASDWAIGGVAAEAVSTTVGGDGDADDDRVQLQITTDGNELPGTDVKDVTYTQGTTADLAGNLLADVASGDVSEADGARPTIVDLEIRDTGTDGLIDEIVVTFSETIDTHDGAAPVAADFGTITLPDGSTADLSGASFTDPGGTSATVTISGIAGQSTANTAPGSTDISGDLSADWVDGAGNALVSTLDDETVTDSAGPAFKSVTTGDTDANGKVDQLTVVFSEAVASGSVEDADFAIGTVNGLSGSLGASSSDDGDDTVLFAVTEGSSFDTGATPTLSYAQAGGSNDKVQDAGGNLMADQTSDAATDGAKPTIVDLEIFNTDKDGFVDKIVVTFSETIDTTDGSAPVASDFGSSITLPDGSTADLSGASFTDPAGTSATVTITGIAGQSTANTATGSTGISGDLSANWVDNAGNSLVSTLDDESVTDSAKPWISSITTLDRDADGKVDAANVIFTEPIDDSTVTPGDWTIGGQAADAVSTTVDGDGDADDGKIQLRITTDADEVDGTDAKDVTYTQGTTADLPGNLLADVGSGDVTEADGARPVQMAIESKDTDGDGQVDRIDITYSEPPSGTAEVADYALGGTDAGNVSLDSAAISGSTVEIAVSGPENDTGLDLTLDYDRTAGTADSIRDGTGNAAASFTGVSISDAAAPQVRAIVTLDRDGDGNTDAANVTFTEAIDDSTIQPGDWAMEGTSFEAVDTTVDGDSDADDEKVQLRITTDADEIDGTDAKDVTYTQGTTADLAGNLLPDVASGDVTETAENVPPTASFDPPTGDVETNERVTLTDDSTDDDGTIASRSWDLGDGNTSTEANVTHRWTRPGTYTVTLIVTDDDGATNKTSHAVTVVDANLTAAFDASDTSVENGTPIDFTDGSFGGNGALSHAWDFGDGNTSTAADPTHAFERVGTYTVSLTVTDGDGNESTTSETIHVFDATDVDETVPADSKRAFWNAGRGGVTLETGSTGGQSDLLIRVGEQAGIFQVDGDAPDVDPDHATTPDRHGVRYLEIEIRGGHQATVFERVTISINYTDALLADGNFDEDTLEIHYWNGSAWISTVTGTNATDVIEGTTPARHLKVFETGHDREANRVWAVVNHTSGYALTASKETSGGGGGGGSLDDSSEPDLHVLDVDVSPSELRVGQDVTVRALVENQGDAGSVSVTFDLGTGTLHERSLHLEAGARANVSVNETIHQPGTYQVRVDGVARGSFEVLAPSIDDPPRVPDLRLVDVEVAPDGPLEVGDTVTVTVRWTNDGTATARRSYAVALDGDNVAHGAVEVGAGEDVSRVHTFELPGAGELELTVDGEVVATLTVQAGGSAGDDGGSPPAVPGFGAVWAAVVLAGAAAAWARRR